MKNLKNAVTIMSIILTLATSVCSVVTAGVESAEKIKAIRKGEELV